MFSALRRCSRISCTVRIAAWFLHLVDPENKGPAQHARIIVPQSRIGDELHLLWAPRGRLVSESLHPHSLELGRGAM